MGCTHTKDNFILTQKTHSDKWQKLWSTRNARYKATYAHPHWFLFLHIIFPTWRCRKCVMSARTFTTCTRRPSWGCTIPPTGPWSPPQLLHASSCSRGNAPFLELLPLFSDSHNFTFFWLSVMLLTLSIIISSCFTMIFWPLPRISSYHSSPSQWWYGLLVGHVPWYMLVWSRGRVVIFFNRGKEDKFALFSLQPMILKQYRASILPFVAWNRKKVNHVSKNSPILIE